MKKSNDIMVSILCAVYNHEKYLEECLNSLVKQKTNFRYEIIVHDDSSSDNSQKIISKYQEKYPDLIIPIYQKENQYSKGVDIYRKFMFPKIRGKYFCWCEGDDYYISEDKIQKQYDFLENNKEYQFCVHNSIVVNTNSERIGKIAPLLSGGDLESSAFIENGGAFVATNSMFSYSKYTKNLPKYFDILAIDYIWQMYLSSLGKTYCIKDFLSAYRMGVSNSWTDSLSSQKEKYFTFTEKLVKALKCFDEETNNEYHSIIEQKIIPLEYDILEYRKEYFKLREYPYKEIRKKKKMKTKIKYYLYEKYPKTLEKIYRIMKGHDLQ